MTELEQYKKAYAILVGRIDEVISDLEQTGKGAAPEDPAIILTARALIRALQEAEEIFLAEDTDE